MTIAVDPLGLVPDTDETNNTVQVQVDVPAKAPEHGYAGCRRLA